MTFSNITPDKIDNDYKYLIKYINKDIDYNLVICFLTPDMAAYFTQGETCKKILVSLWESDRICDAWCEFCNSFDQLWVPGEFNRKVFDSSLQAYYGDSRKLKSDNIKIVNYPIDKPLKLFNNNKNDAFTFYAISQWTERKNFTDLILAYTMAFCNTHANVNLILKTYITKQGDEAEQKQIVDYISTLLKNSFAPTDHIPNIQLVTASFSEKEINDLHSSSHCYVNTSRGEGLGLGLFEAASHGNIVITHLFSEQATYFNSENAIIYNYHLTPVINMRSIHMAYDVKQSWANPDLIDLIDKMKFVFENKNSFMSKIYMTINKINKISDSNNIRNQILRYLESSFD
jgi:hypothetical protein